MLQPSSESTMLRAALLSTSSGWALVACGALDSRSDLDMALRLWSGAMGRMFK